MRRQLSFLVFLGVILSTFTLAQYSMAKNTYPQDLGIDSNSLKKKTINQKLLLSRLKMTQNPQEVEKFLTRLGRFIDHEADPQEKQKLIRWQKKAQRKLQIINQRAETAGSKKTLGVQVKSGGESDRNKGSRQAVRDQLTRLNQLSLGITKRIHTAQKSETVEGLLRERKRLYQESLSKLSYDIQNEKNVETRKKLQQERQEINRQFQLLEQKDKKLLEKMRRKANQRMKENQRGGSPKRTEIQSRHGIEGTISKLSRQIGTETNPQRKAKLIRERETLLRKHHQGKKK